MPNWKKVVVSGSDALLNSVTASFTGSLTGALIGTASWATNALTASFVNTLIQNVIITGSVAIGTSSLGPFENTLTLGARDAANEGGQIGFNAPGGTYTSASFLDNWQNNFRILRGNNTTSDATVANWNLHTKQMQLPQYQNASSFVGTATANLAVDSGGNVITVSTSGAPVFPYVGNAVITGSLTVTQPISVPINGGMYFQGGDDAALYDINVVNTIGIYGVQDSTLGAIKLGSSGPTLYGSGSRLGIGTTTPTSASLTVNGNIWATSITGSLTGSLVGALTGTASWATNATNAINAQTSSVTEAVYTVRNTNNAIFYPTFVDSNNSTKAAELVYTSNSIIFNPGTATLGATNISGSSIFAISGFTGSLQGTASWAVSASQAITASVATSASYALSASYATQALSSSYALTASFALNGGGGAAFPYTGSAIISGSLVITGSFDVGVPGANNPRITSDGTLNRGDGISVDWINKQLVDASTLTSVDWESRILNDASAVASLAWNDRIIYDTSGNQSIDWESRTLFDATATRAMDYNSRVLIYPDGTSTALNYGTQNQISMSGSILVTGSLTVTGSTVITGSVRGNVTALTITSNTASVNLSSGNFFTLNLVGGANTHINPTNINPGQTANIRISQSAAGTGTVSFPSFVDQPSGSLYTGSQVANATDIISLVTFDSNLVYVSSVRNLV